MQLYFILYANSLHNKDGISPCPAARAVQLHSHSHLLLGEGKGSGSLSQPHTGVKQECKPLIFLLPWSY